MIIIKIVILIIIIIGKVILEKSRNSGGMVYPYWPRYIMSKPFQMHNRALAASEAGLFLIVLKGLQPLCNVTRSCVGCCECSISASAFYYCYYYCCCRYFCIINITFIAHIIFIISIFIRIFIKSSLLLASFTYGDMKASDIGRIVDVIWAILCLVVSPVIIDRWGSFFLFVFLLRGVGIMFDNNCRENSCWPYSTSERWKILNYKGLRQAGSIILKWDFKSGACLWIPNFKFPLRVSLLGNVYCYIFF